MFIDLTKAFDFAIREIAIGWPQGSAKNNINLLVHVGHDEIRAAEVARDVDDGKYVLA